MHRAFAVDLNTFNPSTITSIGSLTNVFVKNAFTLAGIVAFVILVAGGIGFIASAGSGDAKGMEKGKKAITAAVFGLILIFMSVGIVQIIGLITGLNLLGK